MSEPYPTDETGEPDHLEAATQLGCAKASAKNPWMFKLPSGEVRAVTAVRADDGTVDIVNPTVLGTQNPKTEQLLGIWTDWQQDRLVSVTQKFLSSSDTILAGDSLMVSASRNSLTALADNSNALVSDMPRDEVVQAIKEVYSQLNIDREIAVE